MLRPAAVDVLEHREGVDVVAGALELEDPPLVAARSARPVRWANRRGSGPPRRRASVKISVFGICPGGYPALPSSTRDRRAVDREPRPRGVPRGARPAGARARRAPGGRDPRHAAAARAPAGLHARAPLARRASSAWARPGTATRGIDDRRRRPRRPGHLPRPGPARRLSDRRRRRRHGLRGHARGRDRAGAGRGGHRGARPLGRGRRVDRRLDRGRTRSPRSACTSRRA